MRTTQKHIGRRLISAVLLLIILCGVFPALPVFASPGLEATVNLMLAYALDI